MQAFEDVDEGHPDISDNVDMPEENIFLEQVTLSKTLDCISFMKYFFHRKGDFARVVIEHVVLRDMCVVDMTFVWTSALTKCNVSHIVWT